MLFRSVYPHGTWDGEILWDGQPLCAQSIRDTEDAGIIIIHQELMLVPQLSVAENIFMGRELTLPGGRMHYAAMYKRADELLRGDAAALFPVFEDGEGQRRVGARAGEAYDTVKLLRGEVQAYFLDAGIKFSGDGAYTMTQK